MTNDQERNGHHVDGLITNTEKTPEQTPAKITAIDPESLNKAIEELHDVLSPISKPFAVARINFVKITVAHL